MKRMVKAKSQSLSCLIITNRGIEDISKAEALEILGENVLETKCGETVVECSLRKKEDFLKLVYNGRSFARVLVLLDSFSFNDDFFERMETSILKIDFGAIISEEDTFRVSCERSGEQEFSSEEVSQLAGERIVANFKRKVSLNEPKVVVYVYIQKNRCYVGIDVSGIELSKRSYNLFSTTMSLKPSVAYSVFRISGFKKGVLIDPFCGNGLIVIEAGMELNKISPRFFDKDKLIAKRLGFFKGIDVDDFFEKEDKKAGSERLDITGYDNNMNHIQYCLKNAKLANVHKLVSFSRVEAEWLDTKFTKDSVDAIVTRLPEISRKSNNKEILKYYRDLFYNAEYILKGKGRIVIVVRNYEEVKKVASDYKFILSKEIDVWQGQELLKVLVFERG
jgi:23S rRNA G2445 N2-methylase RlmL